MAITAHCNWSKNERKSGDLFYKIILKPSQAELSEPGPDVENKQEKCGKLSPAQPGWQCPVTAPGQTPCQKYDQIFPQI